MKPQKSPLSRILHACIYSCEGLAAAFKGEAAFRQELFLFVLLLPILYFLSLPLILKLLLLMVNTIVLITEILNSAIEAIVDLASPEHHDLAKKAKDMGSAAVFLILILATCLWSFAIGSLFFGYFG